MAAGLIRPIRAEWRGAVLVCSKCSKKLGGGFGDKGRMPLAKLLREGLGLPKPKGNKGRAAAVGVIETKCLGPCPKRGVTVIDTRRLDRWMIVPAGMPVADLIGADGPIRELGPAAE